MDLPDELLLKIERELYLEELGKEDGCINRQVYLFHYPNKKDPYEKNLFYKKRRATPPNFEPEAGRVDRYRYLVTSKPEPYHPLFLTCKRLARTFREIQQEHTLFTIRNYGIPRLVDDPGPSGPRRRVAYGICKKIRRVEVLVDFNQKRNDPFFDRVFEAFNVFSPSHEPMFPKVREWHYEIEMLDWQLGELDGYKRTPTPVAHVKSLTVTINCTRRSAAFLLRPAMLNVLLQFPSLESLCINWRMLPKLLHCSSLNLFRIF